MIYRIILRQILFPCNIPIYFKLYSGIYTPLIER